MRVTLHDKIDNLLTIAKDEAESFSARVIALHTAGDLKAASKKSWAFLGFGHDDPRDAIATTIEEQRTETLTFGFNKHVGDVHTDPTSWSAYQAAHYRSEEVRERIAIIIDPHSVFERREAALDDLMFDAPPWEDWKVSPDMEDTLSNLLFGQMEEVADYNNVIKACATDDYPAPVVTSWASYVQTFGTPADKLACNSHGSRPLLDALRALDSCPIVVTDNPGTGLRSAFMPGYEERRANVNNYLALVGVPNNPITAAEAPKSTKSWWTRLFEAFGRNRHEPNGH